MKYLFFFSLSFLIFSCQQQATDATNEKSESVEDAGMQAFEANTETVKKMFAAFAKKDLAEMKTYISDDFVWSPPAADLDSIALPQWEEVMTGFMTDYDDIKYENPLYYAGLGDDQKPDGGVRTYGFWRSTYVPNGKEAVIKYYSVIQFNDEGKIKHQMEWYDTAGLTPAD